MLERRGPFRAGNIESDMRARYFAAHDQAFRRKRCFGENQCLATGDLQSRLMRMVASALHFEAKHTLIKFARGIDIWRFEFDVSDARHAADAVVVRGAIVFRYVD